MLTAHLMLKGPAVDKDSEPRVGLRCDGKSRPWGLMAEPTVIDTTFFHETWNEHDDPLYFLLIDFWHPGLNAWERTALETFTFTEDAAFRGTANLDDDNPSLRQPLSRQHGESEI